MRLSAKLGLTALVAALLLSAAVSTASARNLSVSNQNIRVTWTSLEFVEPTFGLPIKCQVTLEGSFHTRTIAKVRESLIGAINRSIVKSESCTNGRGISKNETLPWHLTYEGFTGTLPNISAVQIGLSRFRFEITAFGCTGGAQYGSETDKVIANANREAGGGITSLDPIEGRNIVSLINGPREVCPRTARMRGAGEVMLTGTTTRITVTLI